MFRAADRPQDSPLVQAAILRVTGAMFFILGEQRLAPYHLEVAVDLLKNHLGPGHPDTLESMHGLAVACEWVGRFSDAIALYQQVLDDRQARLGPDHPVTLACAGRVAAAYRMAGQWDRSARLLEQVLERQRAIDGPAHPATLGTLHRLAMTYADSGQWAQSIALHEQALALLKSTTGPEHESTIWCLLTLGQVCQRAGQLDRAERWLREALEQARKRDAPPGRRTGTANPPEWGTQAKAIPPEIRAQAPAPPERGTQTATVLGWLARNLALQQQYAAAEPLAREAAAIFEEVRPNDPRRFYWVCVLGAVLFGQQKYAEAEPTLRHGYEALQKRELSYSPYRIAGVDQLLRHGYEALKKREAGLPVAERGRPAGAGERIVRFYEATHQPEKAQAWRETLTPAHHLR